MRICELSIDTFIKAVADVNRTLADDKLYTELLDEAARDTPIIAALLKELSMLTDSEPSPRVEKGVAACQRDMTVLLALRAIEQTEAESV